MADLVSKKDIFETIVKEVTCNFCQEIIWNSPIFESSIGLTACSKCKEDFRESTQNWFVRNFKLERVLLAFKTNCEYKKFGCTITEGPHNIILHQENCEYRPVTCFLCKSSYRFRKLFEHIQSTHDSFGMLTAIVQTFIQSLKY